MGRRPAVQGAPFTSQTITPALAGEVCAMTNATQYISYTEMGRQLSVNPGRASEALKGKRT
jgi:hypothetical protein